MRLTVDKVGKIIRRKYSNVDQVWKPYGKNFYIAVIDGVAHHFTREDILKM